jgi:ribosome-binding ATPase YchF (GTP1/OBG family)
MTTDTPLTDSAKVDKGGMTFVWAEFAQELERELAASQAEVARLKKELDAWDYGTRAKREQEARKKAEAEVERLKESLKAWTTID